MHYFLFRCRLTLTALALLFATTTCTKKDDATPVTGIAGTVNPSTALTAVTATASDGTATSVTPNEDSGIFSIANLRAGTYSVRFTAAPGFAPPADRNVSVAEGRVSSIGVVQVNALGSGGPGSIEGTVSPAGSIDNIVLAAPGTSGGLSTRPDVNGYFLFYNIPPGTYNLIFTPATGYVQPAPRSATVTADNRTSVGTIAVTPDGPTSLALRGTVSWQIGSTRYTSTTLAGNLALDSGVPRNFSLTATAQNGTTADILGLTSDSPGTGLYLLNAGTTGNSATYLQTFGGVPGNTYTTRNRPATTGTVTITAFDATARTLSGTFGFTAYDSPLNNAGTVAVANGSFALSY